MQTTYLPLSDELTMFGCAIDKWAEERLPVSALRRFRDTGGVDGYNASVWAEMVALGLPGILVPEEFGGSNAGFEALGLAIEAFGRSLAPTPLISSCLVATSAILAGATPAQRNEWLPKLASGALKATFAHEEATRHEPIPWHTRLTLDDDRIMVNGMKIAVPEGLSADLLVVSGVFTNSQQAGQPALLIVKSDLTGITRKRRHQIDSREYADIQFDDVQVDAVNLLTGAASNKTLLEHVLDCMRIGLSLEMLGGAERAFAVTLDYLKTRVQFGQVIGSFQALQHRAAEIHSRLAMTRYCVRAAMQALDRQHQTVPALASLAKATAGETFTFVADEMIQLHGGIGMTDEFDAGLYLKRSRVADALCGNPAFHRERYARLGGW